MPQEIGMLGCRRIYAELTSLQPCKGVHSTTLCKPTHGLTLKHWSLAHISLSLRSGLFDVRTTASLDKRRSNSSRSSSGSGRGSGRVVANVVVDVVV